MAPFPPSLALLLILPLMTPIQAQSVTLSEMTPTTSQANSPEEPFDSCATFQKQAASNCLLVAKKYLPSFAVSTGDNGTVEVKPGSASADHLLTCKSFFTFTDCLTKAVCISASDCSTVQARRAIARAKADLKRLFSEKACPAKELNYDLATVGCPVDAGTFRRMDWYCEKAVKTEIKRCAVQATALARGQADPCLATFLSTSCAVQAKCTACQPLVAQVYGQLAQYNMEAEYTVECTGFKAPYAIECKEGVFRTVLILMMVLGACLLLAVIAVVLYFGLCDKSGATEEVTENNGRVVVSGEEEKPKADAKDSWAKSGSKAKSQSVAKSRSMAKSQSMAKSKMSKSQSAAKSKASKSQSKATLSHAHSH